MGGRCVALAAVLSLGGLRPIPAVAESPNDQPAVERLVRGLASADYQVRTQAAENLREIGPLALPAVDSASRSPDPEVRAACRRLVILLRQREFSERIDRFLRDSAAVLPGWEEFARLAAGNRPSRRVYARVYQTDPYLIDTALAKSPAASGHAVAALLEERLETLANCGRQGGAGGESERAMWVATATVFAAAARPEAVTDRASQLLLQAARTELAPAAARRDAKGRAARAMTAAWITSSRADGLYVLSQMLRLAEELELREAAPLALAIALGERTDQPAHPQFRATAMLILGRLGDPCHAAALRPLLAERAVCATQAGRSRRGPPLLDVQLRDVAIAVMAHLSGKTPADVGLAHAMPSSDRLFVLHTLAFADESARERALAEWRGELPIRRSDVRVAAGQGGRQVR